VIQNSFKIGVTTDFYRFLGTIRMPTPPQKARFLTCGGHLDHLFDASSPEVTQITDGR